MNNTSTSSSGARLSRAILIVNIAMLTYSSPSLQAEAFDPQVVGVQNAAVANNAVSASDVPGFSALSSGGLNYSSRAALVNLNLISGITKFGNTPVGIEVTLSGPAGSPSIPDYVSAQLLMPNNGFLNVYFSPLASNPKSWAKWAKLAGLPAPVGQRATATDRFYITDKANIKSNVGILASHEALGADNYPILDPNGDPTLKATTPPSWSAGQFSDMLKQVRDEMESARFFITDGLGLKTYKPGVNSGTTTTIEGSGCAYLGAGVDGGIEDFISGSEGAWSLQVFATANAVNKTIMNSIYSTTNAPSTFETGCVKFSISAGQVDLSLFYASALNRGTRGFMKDMAGIAFTLQQPSKTGK
jgi:hypothetical protein